jgi:phytoene dehydrogenase-like protein
VEQIVTAPGKVNGVRMADGSFLEAPIVISNATHHVTFNELMKS